MWTWGDVQEEWVESVRLDHPNLYAVVQAANVVAGEDMGAFLCWLGVRALEMHRVLKPTGSLYLHIDHTAHAYVKAMLDAIFGRRNFRNEIVWDYRKISNSAGKKFSRAHDIILFYSKSNDAVFNALFDDDLSPRKQQLVDKGWNTKNMNGDSYLYIYDQEKVDKAVAAGRLNLSRFNIVRTVDTSKGNRVTDVFEIDFLNSQAKENTKYPTQKPLALYERIIKASSNEGDIVLDPFAGCATTCVAAEHLGREWIAIDINAEAEDVIFDRLQREAKLPPGARSWKREVSVKRTPPKRTDDGEKAAPELVLVSPKLQGPRMSLAELRSQLSVRHGAYCQGCGFTPPDGLLEYLEVDHRLPKSLEGSDDLSNRILLCPPCNGVKSNKKTLAELRENRVAAERMLRKGWDAAWFKRVGRFGEPA